MTDKEKVTSRKQSLLRSGYGIRDSKNGSEWCKFRVYLDKTSVETLIEKALDSKSDVAKSGPVAVVVYERMQYPKRPGFKSGKRVWWG